MQRSKLLKKLAKVIAVEDHPETPLTWSEESGIDQEMYLAFADVALKELARIIYKTPVVDYGEHDITNEFVEFFAGDLDEFAPLDGR